MRASTARGSRPGARCSERTVRVASWRRKLAARGNHGSVQIVKPAGSLNFPFVGSSLSQSPTSPVPATKSTPLLTGGANPSCRPTMLPTPSSETRHLPAASARSRDDDSEPTDRPCQRLHFNRVSRDTPCQRPAAVGREGHNVATPGLRLSRRTKPRRRTRTNSSSLGQTWRFRGARLGRVCRRRAAVSRPPT